MFHIIDVDNTLIYTDILNTKGYLHALIEKGLEPLDEVLRITRDIIRQWYPNLREDEIQEIIDLKQQYVSEHVCVSQLNEPIAEVLTQQGMSRCALWTAAHPHRIQGLLNFHRVTGYKTIRYSDKSAEDVVQAIQYFCDLFECDTKELCFYEDSQHVIRELQRHNVTVKEVRMCYNTNMAV